VVSQLQGKTEMGVDSKGFWWWCKTLGIAGILTLFNLRYSKEHWRTQRSGNWVCFPLQVRGWETSILLGPLERARSGDWGLIFQFPKSCVLRTTSNVQKPSNSLYMFKSKILKIILGSKRRMGQLHEAEFENANSSLNWWITPAIKSSQHT
jgi:hypothetical protein